MDSFEQAFSDTERAATATLTSAAKLVSQAKQLQKAAKEGNIADIKRNQASLDAALADLGQTVANSVQSWPFQDEEEAQYLRDEYPDELRRIVSERGLTVLVVDGQLICHPSVVRVLPGEQAVRIDKRRVPRIRPSYLAGELLANQKKVSGYRPGPFLEVLYKVYTDITREESSGRLVPGQPGRVVPLARIYRLITALPDIRRNYTEMDFARDIYQVQSQDVKTTRSGATVTFPTSTGARSGRGVFTFVGPDGQYVSFYGIQFTEAG